jgi:hypothetical protein
MRFATAVTIFSHFLRKARGHGFRPMKPKRIPSEWREHYVYVERSKQQLQEDLATAFDRIDAQGRALERYKIMVWVLGLLVAGEGAILMLLANFALERLK